MHPLAQIAVELVVERRTWLQVLLVAEALTLVALAATGWLLVRRGREIEELRARLEPPTAPERVRHAAGWAVRTAFDTAGRVRERGLVGGLLMAPIEEFTQWTSEDRAEIEAVASAS